jgi:hypothetical protein
MTGWTDAAREASLAVREAEAKDHNANGKAPGQETHHAALKGAVTPTWATHTEAARKMAALQSTRPHSIEKRFGSNGPNPDQLTAYKAEVKSWNSAYRNAKKGLMPR